METLDFGTAKRFATMAMTDLFASPSTGAAVT